MEINPPARLRPVSWVFPFRLPSGTAGWSLFRSTAFLKKGSPAGRFSSCPQVDPSFSMGTCSHPLCPSLGPQHFAWPLPVRFSHEMLNFTRQGLVPLEAAACTPCVLLSTPQLPGRPHVPVDLSCATSMELTGPTCPCTGCPSARHALPLFLHPASRLLTLTKSTSGPPP